MSDLRSTIDRVAAIYGNPSPSMAESCYAALRHDRPAFWTTTGFEDMTAQHVAWLTNHGAELYNALARFATNIDPPKRDILEALVPLNHKATLALRMAYMSINEYPPLPKLWARQERRP